MLVTTRKETFYKVEMTAEQRTNLIFVLATIDNKESGIWPDAEVTKEQLQTIDDLRVALLNAA